MRWVIVGLSDCWSYLLRSQSRASSKKWFWSSVVKILFAVAHVAVEHAVAGVGPDCGQVAATKDVFEA